MKYTINQGIGIFENAISDEWCDNIIKLFETSIQYHYPRNPNHFLSIDAEDTAINFEELFPEDFQKLVHFLIQKIYPIYTNKFSTLTAGDPHTIKYLKIQKTLPSQGYHVWHCESSGLPTMNRLGAISICLNDVNEGGETEFLYQSLRVPMKKGTVIIWPSGYYHTHRGNPPLSGEKYIATGWLELIETNE